MNKGREAERRVRDVIGKLEGRAGTARRVCKSSSRMRGGVDLVRLRGATKASVQGPNKGCFFFGSYSQLTVACDTPRKDER